jgi:hypothetical protein
MTETHEAAIRTIEELIDANKQMRASLRQSELVLHRAKHALEQGDDIATTFRKVATSGPRQAMTASLQTLVCKLAITFGSPPPGPDRPGFGDTRPWPLRRKE